MQGTRIHFVGNLTADPETRFTNGGVSVTNLRVAVNNRAKQGDDWVDLDPTFYAVSLFREYGEHAAESLKQGDQVMVFGTLKVRTWKGQDDQERTSLDVVADEVGATLRWATLTVKRTPKGERKGQEAGASKGGQFNDEPPF